MNQDTICAIATAQGGAIGCIRVSGPDAIEITSRIFTPARKGKKLKDAKPYTLTFGHIHEEENIIDEVLVSLFRAPHSYTGEDSTEIMCHGSSYILQKVLQLLIGNGCRLAAPGEYTQRAFLGGKMDLSQAEAVADLIASTSAATHRLAMSQMRGGFSKELASLRDQFAALHITHRTGAGLQRPRRTGICRPLRAMSPSRRHRAGNFPFSTILQCRQCHQERRARSHHRRNERW